MNKLTIIALFLSSIAMADFSSDVQFRSAWFNGDIKLGGSSAKTENNAMILRAGSTIQNLLVIKNNGSILMPRNTDDTIVARETTDTLKNKTIDADQNSLSNIADGEIKNNAFISLNKLATLGTNSVLKTNGSGFIVEANNVDGDDLEGLPTHNHDGVDTVKINALNLSSGLQPSGSVIETDGSGGFVYAPNLGGGGGLGDSKELSPTRFVLLGPIGQTFEHIDGYHRVDNVKNVSKFIISTRICSNGSTAVRLNRHGLSGPDSFTGFLTCNGTRESAEVIVSPNMSLQDGDFLDADVVAVPESLEDLSIDVIYSN